MEHFDEINFRKRQKEILLETFKFTIDFFSKNNLRWWAAYGTALGAVRHKGIIPWDDDIDIFMPREDYNRFLNLRNKLINTHYRILSYNNTGYYLAFAKLENTKTTIWEMKAFPYIIGVSIDIFPIDLTDETPEQIKLNFRKFRNKAMSIQNAYSNYSFVHILKMIIKYNIDWFFNFCFYKVFKNKSKLAFNSFEKKLNRNRGDKYVRYAVGGYLILEKSWFDGFEEVQFENLKIRIPSGNNELLTLIFGDYMKLPPIQEQKSHQDYQYYINLKERLSLEEVKKRIKEGERRVY